MPGDREPASAQGIGHRAVVAGAIACFFLSGVAALLYEVVWMRLLGLVFGHTVYAITTVLAAYMGGLALGSVLIGRRADRMRRPLRVYGLLEAAIGVYCLATPLLFRAADAAYLWAHHLLQPSALGSAMLHLALSALLLLPPTTLMGATLPILSRAVVRGHHLAASQVGTLYAVNTWGAVVGTATTGFFLIPALGHGATIWLGVALNLAVAALALLLESRAAPEALPQAPEPAAPRPASAGPEPTRAQVAVALVAIGVSGAASMAYEIAWTRALSLVLGSSTYAFTAMLATFLVGLALGAVVVSRLMRRWRPGLAAFGFVEVAVAVLVVALLPLLGRLPEAVLFVLGRTGVSYGTVLGTQFALSFAVMILPTLLIGATFPLVIAALDRGLARMGRDVGSVYGANTVGTIAGSIATGFFLIRAIGIQGTVLLAAAVNLAVGLAAVLAAPEAGRRGRTVAGAAAAAFAVLALAAPRWDPRVMASGVGVYAEMFLRAGGNALRDFAEGRELLFYDEGVSTTVTVVRDPGGTTLTVNGKGDASNDADMATQLLAGHLGPLLYPEARRALIVGLASGVTIGAMTQHPLEVIDVAELEPAMLEASRHFLVENRNALADPRVHVLWGDGRAILATASQPYDVVVSEPSNPWIAGVANLFTVDFYRAARQRLSPRGIFVQWLQNYSIFTRDMQMVVRTFQEVFPHVSVWAASPNDFLLVATPEPLRLDLAAVERRLAASPGLRQDFERHRWQGENLVFRFFLDEEDARRYSAGAPLNTDDHPVLEFSAPLALYGSRPDRNEETMRSFRRVERPPVEGLDPRLYTGTEGHLRAARAAWLSGHVAEARHQLSRALTGGPLSPQQEVDLGRMLFALGEFEEAHRRLSGASARLRNDPTLGRYLKAASVAREPAVRRDLEARVGPGGGGAFLRNTLAEVYLGLARQRKDPDLYAVALEQLEAEIVVRPGSYQTMNNYAGVLYETGRLDEAIRALRRAVDLNPALATTRFNLGLFLENQGNLAEAAREYEAAARLEPGWQKPRERLAALRARAAPPGR